MQSLHMNLNSKAQDLYTYMKNRNSCRHFVNKEIDVEVLKTCVMMAGTAPSGANKQPWFFSIVTNSDIKKKIREAAEAEEFQFYNNRAPHDFLEDLKQFNTDWKKPHLEEASALIIIFSKQCDVINGEKQKCYYAKESTGIATGFLITALHQLGFEILTHTPNPMQFINEILDRPEYEKPFLILAVGHRSPGTKPLRVAKKELDQICQVFL